MNDYLSTLRICERLAAEREALVSCVERVPLDLRDKRPGPNRWSIAEVLEHLTRMETGLTKLLMLRGQAPPPTDTPEPEASSVMSPELGAVVRDRSKRVEAPERVQPAGGLPAEEVLTRLHATRAGMIEAFESADPGALDRLTHPHPIFGPLTLRSWIALAADHEARHAQQITEIAQQLGAS